MDSVYPKNFREAPLGCVDISPQPDECADKAQETEIALAQLLKTRKDAAIMLDLVDETLYQMTFLVEVLVILPALLSILARRNDNFRFFVNNHLDEVVSIIGAISDYSLKAMSVINASACVMSCR